MNTQDTANQVKLLVGGVEYGGWKSVRIEAGIERQARSFTLQVTDRWPGQTEVPRRVRAFDACQVYIGGDLVLTGYVDATPVKYTGKSVSVGVKGRSKTADLVDCCPINADEAIGSVSAQWGDMVGLSEVARVITPPARSASQWRNQNLEVIASALAAPYGVRVATEVDTGRPIADHQVQVGETVFESIDRMMRLRHVLSTDNAAGDLIFIDVGSTGRAETAIELGVNVLTADSDQDFKEVFSDYIVKGQRAGDDDQFSADVAEEEGEALDDGGIDGGVATTADSRARRRRVLVLKQTGQADEGTCSDRAEYERANRAAKALQATYTVNGWRQQNGALWQPNLLVQVRDALIGINAEMVIAECAWVLDATGMRTELKVGPVDGYRSKAAKAGKKKGGGVPWTDVKR